MLRAAPRCANIRSSLLVLHIPLMSIFPALRRRAFSCLLSTWRAGLALLIACCYYADMDRRQNGGNDGGNSGWVTTNIAAEALGVSSRSVRNYILNGDLVARKEKEGVSERYVVSVDSLYALRDRRKQEGKLQGNRRRAFSHSEATLEGATELVRETAVDILRETLWSLETHIAQNAELRVRLELTERAESTLREELERERQQHREDVQRERAERLEAQERAERLEQERARLEAEHRRAEEEAQSLREGLEAERGKGFWRRLFGG